MLRPTWTTIPSVQNVIKTPSSIDFKRNFVNFQKFENTPNFLRTYSNWFLLKIVARNLNTMLLKKLVKKILEQENDDIIKENDDAKIKMKDDEKETEKEEPTEEATTEDKVIIEKEKTTGKSYRSFTAKMFKRDSVSDKKGEEPVKMENEETTEDKPEEQPKEEEEKKVVEDKTTTETKEEEKEPTPNTSF